MAEWSKALAWKVSIRQKRIEGSNPSRSAKAASKLLKLIDILDAVVILPPKIPHQLRG